MQRTIIINNIDITNQIPKTSIFGQQGSNYPEAI